MKGDGVGNGAKKIALAGLDVLKFVIWFVTEESPYGHKDGAEQIYESKNCV